MMRLRILLGRSGDSNLSVAKGESEKCVGVGHVILSW